VRITGVACKDAVGMENSLSFRSLIFAYGQYKLDLRYNINVAALVVSSGG